jgi:two-component system, NtrC family, response regulator HydG
VRIIIATNENLQEGISRGKFREDLYHRFNEFTIYMPALRELGGDIMLLANHFLQMANAELGRNVTSFSPEVEECFVNYRWAGNIRELKNVVRRATLITEGDTIQLKALPLEISNYRAGTMPETMSMTAAVAEPVAAARESRHDLKNAAQEAEYDTILKVLREVNFNKTKAAEILNIDRKTLYNKMKAINLSK